MDSLPLGILISLVWNSCALPPRPRSPLDIHPLEPLVEVGGSIQLHCSLDCPGGKVQWEGLDTDLGNVVSNPTSSILTVTNAAVRMEGLKICTGQCQGRSFQKTVKLQVYSLPDTLRLDSQPTVPTAGQSARLVCWVSHVYPLEDFTLRWFQGDDPVKRPVEEDMEDSEMFTFHSELEIPVAAEDTTYRCEAELKIGQRLLRQSRTVTVQAQEKQEIAATTETASSQTVITASHLGMPESPVVATDGNSSLKATPASLPAFHTTERPTILTPVGTTTAAPMLEALTSPTVARNPSAGSPPTAQIPSGEASTVSSNPTARASSTAGKHSTWTSTRVPETLADLGVTSKALPTTDQQPATEPVSTTTGHLAESTAAEERDSSHTVSWAPAPEGLCRPVITSSPPQGTVGGRLRITCRAAGCRKDTQVGWVETPVVQSRYRQEMAEGWSVLAVDSLSLEHQGVYRCVVKSGRPRVASIRVVIVDAALLNTNAIITIGTTGSVFGVLVASYVSRRVWQRHGS